MGVRRRVTDKVSDDSFLLGMEYKVTRFDPYSIPLELHRYRYGMRKRLRMKGISAGLYSDSRSTPSWGYRCYLSHRLIVLYRSSRIACAPRGDIVRGNILMHHLVDLLLPLPLLPSLFDRPVVVCSPLIHSILMCP